MEEPQPPKRLVPARPPDLGDARRGGFLPRLPWLYLALFALVIAAVVWGFNWRQEQRAAALRVELRRVHTTELQSLRAEYGAALDKLQNLIGYAAAAPIEPAQVDESLRFASLHESSILYFRLPLASASSAEQIAAAARNMEPDWIPSCLGWQPISARGLYEVGEFLQPSFLEPIDSESLMQLRAREETLNQRLTKDLAELRSAMHAPWLMLVLQEGKSRSEQPVRVFLWNMRQEKLVFAARVRAQGILLTGKILSQGTASDNRPSADGAAKENDCSIASALNRIAATSAANGGADRHKMGE